MKIPFFRICLPDNTRNIEGRDRFKPNACCNCFHNSFSKYLSYEEYNRKKHKHSESIDYLYEECKVASFNIKGEFNARMALTIIVSRANKLCSQDSMFKKSLIRIKCLLFHSNNFSLLKNLICKS